MKCPKCDQEIADNVKFCTKCGANIEEEKKKQEEEELKREQELERRKKEIEDRKKLEEIRRQEELKREEELKEAEKAEAIRKAKEEGIELEIIDQPQHKEETPNSEFKKKEDEKTKSKKKKKVKIKKNIFQRIFNKIIFMIIVAALIIGGVYYCYNQGILPEVAQKQVEEFDKTLQNVINLNKEVKENDKSLQAEITENENWVKEPTIDADDIKDLNTEVSIIEKDKKQGLISNDSGEIILEAKYSQILNTEYYDIDKTENEKETGIVIKDIEKYYKLDKDYKVSTEVNIINNTDKVTYFYDHHGPAIYYNSPSQECTLVKANTTTKKELKVCTDIDLVTNAGIAAKDADLPESFSIDFAKSTLLTKGYFDTATGELAINCDYDEAYDFTDGYAAVKKDKLAGIINEKGEEVIKCKYQETRSVHDKKMFVEKDGKWGILKI